MRNARDRLLSFFIPDTVHNRHVVLRDKERSVRRRHGTLLRTGQGMLPDEEAMCVTCWMHGVFGAQLTLGNTSFHKLFSVSRDPYNITRASGLRILVDIGADWRLLAVPSAFEMGLSDCRWIYRLGDADDHRACDRLGRRSGDPMADHGRGKALPVPRLRPSRPRRARTRPRRPHRDRRGAASEITFRPDPNSLWGQRYPDAVYHLVVSTPDAVEPIGGDELLYADGRPRGGALRGPADPPDARALFRGRGLAAGQRERRNVWQRSTRAGADSSAMLAPAARYWERVTRGLRITGRHPDVSALDTIFPWLAHNAMMHLTVPHGLEQYTGAAWGTRDVCQGPVEFFLSLEHDEPVKEILRIVFAQQYESRGDWPQWFMLEPYSSIQDRHCHGDVIIWPLKALCDYLECTNDLAFLDEPVAWRREADFARTERKDSDHLRTSRSCSPP